MEKETENKAVASARERMLAKAQERFPEKKFSLESAQNAQEGGVDDLDDAIDQMLQEYADGNAEYKKKNDELAALLRKDPSSAEFLQRWIETGDPRQAIVDMFGDELGMDEEHRGTFKSQLDSWKERKATNDALNEQAETNWQESLTALEEWGNGKGLSVEQKRDVMLRLLAITFNGMENKYGAEDFDLALAAINHDKDVDTARKEGEVAGRNQKIAAARRDRNVAGAMPPAPIGSQGVRASEPSVQKPRSVWADLK